MSKTAKPTLGSLIHLNERLQCLWDSKKKRDNFAQIKQIVDRYYPKLANFFLPLESPTANEYLPPLRWGEPIFRRFIKNYKEVFYECRSTHNDANTERDIVYRAILNPNIKKAIRNRKMNAETYSNVLEAINLKPEQALLGSGMSRAVMAVTADIAIAGEKERILDNSTPEVLAIEGEMTTLVAKRLLAQGYSGSRVVDMGYLVKEKGTTTAVAKDLLKHRIDDWSTIVDAARSVGCSVKTIARITDELGSVDAEWILGIISDAVDSVQKHSMNCHIMMPIAWARFFKVFRGQGNYNLDTSLDIFNGELLDSWHPDDMDYE